MADDDDLVITVDSLDEPFDTTIEAPKPARTEPVRLKVPGRDTPKPQDRDQGDATVISADDPVENLRGQINALTQRATAAERRVDEVTEQARSEMSRARTVVADTRVQALDREIEAATTESSSLKQAAKAAMDAGDFAKATDLQEQMADARARLYHAKQQKSALENAEPVTRPHQGAVRQPAAPAAPTRRGAVTAEERRQAILANCTPASRQWLENHPDVLDDPEKGAMAQVVHERALKQGITPDSPEYFRYAEEQLGYTRVSSNQNTRRQQNGALPRARIEAAPVDRGGAGGAGGSDPVRVTLTPGEAAAATDGTHVWNYGPNKGKPLGLKEFARRKAIMQNEGRYNNPAVS